MIKVKDYEFIVWEGTYLHIRLKNAKFATEDITISKNPLFFERRIIRAKNKLIKREELFAKHFVGTF